MAKKGEKLPAWHKKIVSEAAKLRWQEPAYRAKMIAAISIKSKARWQDPKYRAAMIAKAKILQADPKYRKTLSEATKKAHAARPAWGVKLGSDAKKRWKDPKFRVKEIERLKKLANKRWADPNYRAHTSTVMKANAHGLHRETTLEAIVVNWARKHGVLAFKTDAHYCVGAPDRIFMVYGGKPVLIEFKRPDGKGSLSKIQLHTIRKLQKAKYDVCVANNKEQAISYLQKRMHTVDAAQISRKGN